MLLAELTGIKSQRGKTAADVLRYLKKFHNISVTHGMYGVVLMHPSWDYVLKFVPKDECYLAFVDYCIKHPSKHLPVFKKKPTKLSVFFKNSFGQEIMTGWMEKLEKIYAVRIEKLQRVTSSEADAVQPLTTMDFYQDYKKAVKNKLEDELLASYMENSGYDAVDLRPFRDLARTIYELFENLPSKCVPDLHEDNFMKRGKDIVIIDPYAKAGDEDEEEIFNITKIVSWGDLTSLTSDYTTVKKTASVLPKL